VGVWGGGVVGCVFTWVGARVVSGVATGWGCGRWGFGVSVGGGWVGVFDLAGVRWGRGVSVGVFLLVVVVY